MFQMVAMKKWLLMFAVLIGGLLASEVVARWLYADKVVMFPRFHTDAQYGLFTIRRLRPNTTFWHTSVDGRWQFRVNANGFRADQDYSYAKRPGCLRVLCLGDSVTAGFECRQDKTYASVLERYLRKRGYDAEVINAGVSGFGTAEQLVFLENEGIKYRPDVVVVAFYCNDLEDSVKADIFRLKDGQLVTNKFVHIPGVKILNVLNGFPPTRWLSQHSYLYSVLLNGVWEAAKGAAGKKAAKRVTSEFALKQGDEGEALRTYQQELGAALLKRLYQSCRAVGAKMILLDVPSLHAKQDFVASIPAGRETVFAESADHYISSSDLLADWVGADVFFAPHGHHHPSETTHMLVGVRLGKWIQENFPKEAAAHVAPR
jgi:lysophospholipase L1-like esterase